MKFIYAGAVIVAATILGGCSQSAPKCSDNETVALVKEITRDGLVSQFGQEVSDSIQLEVDAIRTTDFNDKTGSQQCAAQLTIKSQGDTETADITYTSELADNGEKFYVTVYGL
ncbi:hypothetical protein [Halomonas sp. SCS19]|uniref:hypothetical protein n=1 Tax=Halomonas sp. SCS19 TaxID=2950870 RepID=UPI0032DF0AC4